MLIYGIFVLSFVLLIQGAQWFVDGAASIAYRLKIPPLVIGLTIVSLGTSAPETLISATASFQNHAALALGNVFGSIITNTLLGLGLAALLSPLKVQNSTVFKEIPYLIFSLAVVTVMASDSFFGFVLPNKISRWDGTILLVLFVGFLAYTTFLSQNKSENEFEEDHPQKSFVQSLFLFSLGLVSLIFGSKWCVSSAITISAQYGVSESVIGLTVVAIGTALPEITTSVVASLKGHADMALGNVIGSNLFNALWTLGLCSIIRPLEIQTSTLSTALFAIGINVMLVCFLLPKKNRVLSRTEALAFVGLYVCYGYFVMSFKF